MASRHLRTPPELHREVRTDTSKFSFRVEKTSQPSQERNHVLVRTAGELDRWLSNRKVVGADVRAYIHSSIHPSIHPSHHIQASITSSSGVSTKLAESCNVLQGPTSQLVGPSF
ncbi:hypothetical protein HER10_EVM0011817 [Colletotrichum scovillei]|uniref:uncharacterized protein n=1 Tax=Colletotrichum scovillei TaxID=1209932 RepID=UPI0015C4089C|nr:uncharacterized protein HER10_EVM0011817 [Colletotrichum scovillei]KAF4777133.1 hypothetical protein HER10_EVM0011817 [Colletotrichum scovillei]